MVYLITTGVSLFILSAVYVEPAIDPSPDTRLQEPPEGVPVKVLVCPAEIDAALVVFSAAARQIGVTVKVTSSELAAQPPFAAIVYLIDTCVSVLILSGV